MRIITYTILSCLLCFLPATAQKVYKGKVKIKQQEVELKEDNLYLEMEISLQGITIGAHESLQLMPMLKAGKDSLIMQPILINGTNRQKMYKRALSLQGKVIADAGAYQVIKNEPCLLLQLPYKQTIYYKPWMADAEFFLIGEFCNYKGTPKRTYIDLLTEKLQVF